MAAEPVTATLTATAGADGTTAGALLGGEVRGG
jgi:hypothetical protein